MKNLLKLEFVKLKRRKSFYICTLIMLGLIIISNLTIKAFLSLLPDVIGDITSSGIDSLVSGLSNSSFTLITSIFVILFVCEDYTNQAIKNIYAKGYSRTNVFLSKIISVVISTTIMFLIVEIASFISGTLFFGIGKIESYKFLLLIAAQYLAAMAEIIFAFVIASEMFSQSRTSVPMLIHVAVLIIKPSLFFFYDILPYPYGQNRKYFTQISSFSRIPQKVLFPLSSCSISVLSAHSRMRSHASSK
jgi:ABC-type transport system involved in multi-copper enzyme maturation permease subunit